MSTSLKTWSEERKHNHSIALMGHPVSDATREKLSVAMKIRPLPAGMNRKGVQWSESSREAWGLKQRGMKRKPHTIATRILMSAIARAKRPVLRPDESYVERKGSQWSIWRMSVFQRDAFTCLKCKRKGVRLHPHHIENFASNKALRFVMENGATLCVKCHRGFHRQFGKKHNNAAQFESFLSQST